jgi:DNA-binding NarL/FixJ family response regulator
MNRTIVVYSLLGGVLIVLLKVIEYRFLVVEHSLELYGALVAVIFAALGVWLGRRLTRPAPASASASASALQRARPTDQVIPSATSMEQRVDGAPGAAQRLVPAVSPPAVAAPEFVADGATVAALRLTKRELEILALLAAGLSNREIAGQIFVSENTVKTHASRLFEKLQARRRTQAVQIGKQRGLIP